eukprot:636896-Amphidinium_carterae.1
MENYQCLTMKLTHQTTVRDVRRLLAREYHIAAARITLCTKSFTFHDEQYDEPMINRRYTSTTSELEHEAHVHTYTHLYVCVAPATTSAATAPSSASELSDDTPDEPAPHTADRLGIPCSGTG